MGCLSAVDVSPDGAVTVELHNTSVGLGFSLEGGRSLSHGDRPLTVKRIFKGDFFFSDKMHTHSDVTVCVPLLTMNTRFPCDVNCVFVTAGVTDDNVNMNTDSCLLKILSHKPSGSNINIMLHR